MVFGVCVATRYFLDALSLDAEGFSRFLPRGVSAVGARGDALGGSVSFG